MIRKSPKFVFAVSAALVLNDSHTLGRELEGVYAPAADPSLSPEEAQKRFEVPEGFEVRLFAAEPQVINPVAMSFDDRGRVWIAELFEYPSGAPEGEKPRDQVKVLEDTDGDGLADKVTVFADGLNLATGLLFGDGGVYVGQAPDLLFFKDTDGDDVADTREVVLTGFGLEDRHELLNGFTWGPDGMLYMTHGVFTHSKVRQPGEGDDEGVVMNAAVARVDTRTKSFEIFADGTSNPWGVDFDATGQAFISACVIDHMFHMAPGGHYQRQGGSPEYAYSYGLLPSIVDHQHFRAAYAGIQVYQGNQFPESYQGSVFIGNIHSNTVHRDVVAQDESSFVSSEAGDFLVANDGWFRPVSTQTGPDGALWVMDWHDKYPCYQNALANPEGVDREHGRIWRVVYTGDQPGKAVPPVPQGMDLGKLSTDELVATLSHANNWHRRMAKRLLIERQDPESQKGLVELFRAADQNVDARLEALWTLHATALLDEAILDEAAKDATWAIRMWAARLTGERRSGATQAMERLVQLAANEHPQVRSAVATALRQHSSGALTINRPVAEAVWSQDLRPALAALIKAAQEDEEHPLIPFLVWTSIEPRLIQDSQTWIDWLAEQEGVYTEELANKFARRLSDLGKPEEIDRLVQLIEKWVEGEKADLAGAAIDGILRSQEAKAILPNQETDMFFAVLAAHDDAALRDRAHRLGALWGDDTAIQSFLERVGDPSLSLADRTQAIETVARFSTDGVRKALLDILGAENQEQALVTNALRALTRAGNDETGAQILERWENFSPVVRGEAAQTLVARRAWAIDFLEALKDGKVATGEVPVPVMRQVLTSDDEELRELANEAIGSFRETRADLAKVIQEKREVVLAEGEIDLEQGKLMATGLCFTCHQFYGQGVEVGPDLTGSGRSNVDALLSNLVDPNQIIGRGYENVIVKTTDGRTFAGRLVEDNDTRVGLLLLGGRKETIARSEVESVEVTGNSVMPEGLWQLPDDALRNLVWYILNPPEEGRPMTDELYSELTGQVSNSESKEDENIDREAVALWNPEWLVVAPDFEGSPKKLVDFEGRKNVLVTHPYERDKPASLERNLTIPEGKKAVLKLTVAAHEEGDWELHVLADGEELHQQVIEPKKERWHEIQVDLTPLAGKKVHLKLQNHANDWMYEFGYWGKVEVQIE